MLKAIKKLDTLVLRAIVGIIGMGCVAMLTFFLKDWRVLLGGLVGVAVVVSQIKEKDKYNYCPYSWNDDERFHEQMGEY